METIDLDRTVGELVVRYPSLADLFEEFQLDYCCGGNLSLEDACKKSKLDFELMKTELKSALLKSKPSANVVGKDDPFSSIVEHILTRYHEPTKKLLQQVVEQSAKVAKVHGEKNNKLDSLNQHLNLLAEDLLPHMEKEEKVLFPYLLLLDDASSVPEIHCGTVANPISVMKAEHERTGELLSKIRELADDYTPPEWACNTYRVLLERLKTLEQETHKHIHLENNLLFPKTLAKVESLN